MNPELERWILHKVGLIGNEVVAFILFIAFVTLVAFLVDRWFRRRELVDSEE